MPNPIVVAGALRKSIVSLAEAAAIAAFRAGDSSAELPAVQAAVKIKRAIWAGQLVEVQK